MAEKVFKRKERFCFFGFRNVAFLTSECVHVVPTLMMFVYVSIARNFFPEGRKKILWGSPRELTPKGFFSRGKNFHLRFCEGCQAKRNVSPISRRELARASGDRADSGVARNGTPDNKILWNARSDRSVQILFWAWVATETRRNDNSRRD